MPNTKRGNFDALWQMLDERYCFFDYKKETYGLDWQEVYARYAPAVNEEMNRYELFELLSEMSYELRDGHVNLFAAHNTARYNAWFENFPANYSDSLQRIYLGKAQNYFTTAGLAYRIFPGNIGYLRCGSFETNFGDGNLQEVMAAMQQCDALIVDVRSNGGGLLTAAEKLASLFIDEPIIGGYIMHKTGSGHNDFSQAEAMHIEPFRGLRWQKPVAILTNRRTYSAANSFVMFLKGLPSVRIIGDKTGGGSGMPFNSELPNGWDVRFSACPMLDRRMQHTEFGIDPDIKIDISSADYNNGIDSIIEKARELLKRE